LGLLKNEISKGNSNRFLIDGYPRKLEQAVAFEKEICPASLVVSLESPDDVMVARILERAKTSGRADDNEESAKKRLNTFHEQSQPVLSYYKDIGIVRSLDGTYSLLFIRILLVFITYFLRFSIVIQL